MNDDKSLPEESLQDIPDVSQAHAKYSKSSVEATFTANIQPEQELSCPGELVSELVWLQQFYAKLSLPRKYKFAVVTSDISVDSCAGLQNVKRRLWDRQEIGHVIKFIFMLGRISLNIFMSGLSISIVFGKLISVSGEIVLEDDGLKLCSHRLDSDDSSSGDGCIVTKIRRAGTWRVLVTVEVCIFYLLLCAILLQTLCLLARGRGRTAAHHYFIFMMLPRIACKFSLLALLHLANISRLMSLYKRNEFAYFAALLSGSLERLELDASEVIENGKTTLREAAFAEDDDDLEKCTNRADSTPESHISAFPSAPANRSLCSRCWNCRMPRWCRDLVCFVLVLGAITGALQMLLMKLTVLYFACLFSFHDWSLWEWAIFAGFVNQLSGISMASEVEVLRVLLFKFGGQNSRWSRREVEACDMYFQYLAYHIVKQLGPCRGLMVMWAMSSEQLQQLFQGHLRANEQRVSRKFEVEMYQHLHNKEQLVSLRQQLLEKFIHMTQGFEKSVQNVPAHNRMPEVDRLQRGGIGALRLAAKVQEFIWFHEKDRFK